MNSRENIKKECC